MRLLQAQIDNAQKVSVVRQYIKRQQSHSLLDQLRCVLRISIEKFYRYVITPRSQIGAKTYGDRGALPTVLSRLALQREILATYYQQARFLNGEADIRLGNCVAMRGFNSYLNSFAVQ